jgi:hypothetical protein
MKSYQYTHINTDYHNFLCVLCTKCMKLTNYGLVMSVSLSVRMIQLENHWTDLDKIWCGRYAIGDYPKILFYNYNR